MMGLSELREECVHLSRDAYLRGLVSASGGNISARVEGKDRVLITRTGVSLKDLRAQDLLLLDLEGNLLEGSGEPSKETSMHLGLYRVRGDVHAIFHTHSPYATTYSVVGKEIPLVTVEAQLILERCPLIPYGPPGSRDLADLVVEAFRDPGVKVGLLQSHGAVAVGRNLREAYEHADLLEATAQIATLALQIEEGPISR